MRARVRALYNEGINEIKRMQFSVAWRGNSKVSSSLRITVRGKRLIKIKKKGAEEINKLLHR